MSLTKAELKLATDACFQQAILHFNNQKQEWSGLAKQYLDLHYKLKEELDLIGYAEQVLELSKEDLQNK